ncbi:MAG: UMP kinase [Desulfurococcales archaeon]|nr:UMP kinase [Desulfurococcales archaeon]
MPSIVLKITGHYVSPPTPEYIQRLAETLDALAERGYRVAIVAGGGETARNYIATLRKHGAPEGLLDEIGIEAARLNALLLAYALLPRTYPKVPHNTRELLQAWTTGLVPVMGGFQPGQSTNAVSLLVAEAVGSDLVVNLSRVNGVYTGDPKKDPKAKKLDTISLSELRVILASQEVKAGTYQLLDRLAMDIAERSKIRIAFVHGSDPYNAVKVIDGEKIGTMVYP